MSGLVVAHYTLAHDYCGSLRDVPADHGRYPPLLSLSNPPHDLGKRTHSSTTLRRLTGSLSGAMYSRPRRVHPLSRLKREHVMWRLVGHSQAHAGPRSSTEGDIGDQNTPGTNWSSTLRDCVTGSMARVGYSTAKRGRAVVGRDSRSGYSSVMVGSGCSVRVTECSSAGVCFPVGSRLLSWVCCRGAELWWQVGGSG